VQKDRRYRGIVSFAGGRRFGPVGGDPLTASGTESNPRRSGILLRPSAGSSVTMPGKLSSMGDQHPQVKEVARRRPDLRRRPCRLRSSNP